MKLDKAVEILNDLLTTSPQYDPDDRRDAVQLGIEALERLRHFRNRTLFTVRSPLLHEEVEPRYPKNASDSPDNP